MSDHDIAGARRFFESKIAYTTGTHEVFGQVERKDDVVIVDVRMPTDFRAGHVPGAVNLPRGTWASARGLSRDKLNILYCYSQTCHMAAEAGAELAALGYAVQEMEGGFATWQSAGYPVEAAESTAQADAAA